MKDSFQFSLPADLYATACVNQFRTALPKWLRHSAGFVSGAGLGMLAVLIAFAWQNSKVPGPFVFYVAIAVLACLVVGNSSYMWASRRLLRSSTYASLPRSLTVTERGLGFTTPYGEELVPWTGLAGAVIRGQVVHVSLDSLAFHPVPVSAFGTRAEAEEFVAYVNERIRGASTPATTPAEPVAVPAAATIEADPFASAQRKRWTRLLQLTADAIRITFFLAPKDGRPQASWGTVFLLTVTSVLVPSAFSLFSAGLGGEFSSWMLPGALVHVPLILGAAIVAAYALDRTADVPQLMAAGLLAAIVIDVAAGVALLIAGPSYAALRFTFSWIPVTWLVLAMGTSACRKTEPGLRRAGALAACIVLIAPMDMAPRERSLWHEAYDKDKYAQMRKRMAGVAVEDVFYKQPELLSQSLEAIRPGRKGVVDVYFVAMAGYGDQDVFRREVDATTQLMSEHFAAGGHSIRLVNNSATLREMPIASKTSLRAALHRVASVMDKDEDILVLFMTSHGSEKTGFSLELGSMSFEDLDPATLRALLDESGIVNRVVIVSACYSGSYVKALQEPNTLVVTASAADKTSFGCSNEAQWTYFDKAYIDEGLRQTHSFTKAFELAKPLIAQRESKVGAEASDPQISLGAGIAPRLRALEAQLDQ